MEGTNVQENIRRYCVVLEYFTTGSPEEHSQESSTELGPHSFIIFEFEYFCQPALLRIFFNFAFPSPESSLMIFLIDFESFFIF